MAGRPSGSCHSSALGLKENQPMGSLSPQQVPTAEPFHTPLGQRSTGSQSRAKFKDWTFFPRLPEAARRGRLPRYISIRLAGPSPLHSALASRTCATIAQKHLFRVATGLHGYQIRGASAQTHLDDTKALHHQVVKAAGWGWQEAKL